MTHDQLGLLYIVSSFLWSLLSLCINIREAKGERIIFRHITCLILNMFLMPPMMIVMLYNVATGRVSVVWNRM